MASSEIFGGDCTLFKFEDNKWTKVSKNAHVQLLGSEDDEGVTLVLKNNDKLIMTKKASELTIKPQQEDAVTVATEDDTYSIKMNKGAIAEFTEKVGSTPEAEQESKDAEAEEDAEVDEADEGAEEGDLEGDLYDEGDFFGEGDEGEEVEQEEADGDAKPATEEPKSLFTLPSSSEPFTLSSGLFSADNTSVPKFNFDFGTFSSLSSSFAPAVTSGDTNEEQDADDGKEFIHEESSATYTPVMKLAPQEVDSGEANENLVWKNPCVLFRFDREESDWKERGRGDVKLLQHKQTSKVRLVLREDKTLKLRLNQIVHPSLSLQPKTERSWTWCAVDHSEGEPIEQTYAIRFKTKDMATEFNDLYSKAREVNSGKIVILDGSSLPTQQPQSEADAAATTAPSKAQATLSPATQAVFTSSQPLFAASSNTFSLGAGPSTKQEDAAVAEEEEHSSSSSSSSSEQTSQAESGLRSQVTALTAERDVANKKLSDVTKQLMELKAKYDAEKHRSQVVVGLALGAGLAIGAAAVAAFRLLRK